MTLAQTNHKSTTVHYAGLCGKDRHKFQKNRLQQLWGVEKNNPGSEPLRSPGYNSVDSIEQAAKKFGLLRKKNYRNINNNPDGYQALMGIQTSLQIKITLLNLDLLLINLSFLMTS